MSRLLFATWDGAGNFPPERALVRSLVARGHDVHVLTHDVHRPQVEADGARFEGYATATQIDSSQPGVDMILGPEILGSPRIAADFAAAIERLKPDVLLVDCVLLTAMQAAAASGRPWVALLHTAYSLAEREPFSILKEPIDRSDLVLAFSYRAFDPGSRPPEHTTYVGPLRPALPVEPWRRRLPERPLVVASLSTSHQDQGDLLSRLCEALGGLQVEAVVTTGRGFDPDCLQAPPNVTVTRHIAHEALLDQTDLLISHAGHGTVMAGAAFGVPMLCLPMGRDQPLVAAQAKALGLAHVADPQAGAEDLRSAIAAALADRELGVAARAFAATAAGQRDADLAARRVEGLLIATPA